jgi:signal transduction histidine kinase
MRVPGAPATGDGSPVATRAGPPVGLEPVPSSAWQWLLIGSAAVLAVDVPMWLAGPPLRSVAAVLAMLVIGAALVAVVAGMLRYRPAHPLAWRLIVAGFVVAVVGEALAKLDPSATYPSAKDVCFLAMYALLVAGIGVMARARIQGAGRAAVLDSLIVTIALGLIAAEFLVFPLLVEPYLGDPTLSGAARWITIGALVGDMLLLAGGVLLAAGGPLHPPSLVLLLTGVALQLVDDTVSAALMSDSAVSSVARLLSYSFLGAAALHPSMRALTEPAPPRAPHLSVVRVALLVVAAVLTPLIVLSVASARHPTLAGGLLAVAVVLAILVFARIWGLSAAISAQSSRYQRLLDENVRAREDERLQIAADLHDGPIQRLTSMGLTAELARRRLAKGNKTGTARLLEQLTGDLGDEVMSLRRVMVELRPPVLEEWGLSEALHAYVADFERRTGIKCLIRARTGERFDHSRETILYRVTQEALTNVAKHARADHVWIALSATGGTVGLVIRDDGDGFDPATLDVLVDEGHFGLAGIRQRVEVAGGTFKVSSEPGKGTTIVVSLPPPGEVAAGLAGMGAPPAGRAGGP